MDKTEDMQINKLSIRSIDKIKTKSSLVHRGLRELGFITEQIQNKQPVVFLVEDEAVINRLCTEELEKAGFKVFCYENSVEAKPFISEEKPDIIISGVMQPKEDGLTFLKEVKSNPEYENIIFILFTLLDMQDVKDKADELGVDGFLSKREITSDLFIKEIFNIIERKAPAI